MIRLTHHTRAIIGCMAAALAIAGASSLSAQAARAQGDLEAEGAEAAASPGEERLSKLLEGRVAGRPTECIGAVPSQQMQTVNGAAYVYGRGDTIYVQRTRNPEDIRDVNVLISDRRSTSQLCRLDVVRAVDRFTGQFMGAVFFENFVPYTRVRPDGTNAGA